METMTSKVSVLQNRLRRGRLSISFSNTFWWLLPNAKKKCIPLNDSIVWCKTSSKICQAVVGAPKYLAAKLFDFLCTQRFSLLLVTLDILIRSNRPDLDREKPELWLLDHEKIEFACWVKIKRKNER